MRTSKAFRFRVYPTHAQVARLEEWDRSLRFLWNLAHEQRKLGYARPRDERRFPSGFDQMKELTELRASLPWLEDVPRNVCDQLLKELDKAWQRCFAKLARAPRWKRKGRDFLSFCEPHPKTWSIDGTTVRFPKLGNLRAVVHRPLEGKPKTCTLRRDGDQWFVSIVCEVEIADAAPRLEPVLAIDRGITNFGGTRSSAPYRLLDGTVGDEELIPNPEFFVASLIRLGRAQRTVSRRKKGSKNREKAKRRVARVHQTVRRQREHYLHVLTARLAKSHGIVVLEKLNVAGMVRSNLGRSISDAGWSSFANMLRYKLAWSGGTLVEVPAAYSSQTCSSCGVPDALSRRQSVFRCTSCSYEDHADLNAAKILLSRANRSVLLGEDAGSSQLRRTKKRLRVAKRLSPEKPLPLGRG